MPSADIMTPIQITSRHNPRVKDAVRLRDKRQRERQGRFLIEGAREIVRAVAAGLSLAELFVCEEYCTTDERKLARTSGEQAADETFVVVPEVFRKLSFGERSEGVLAVARTPQRELADLRLPPQPLVAVLDHIEKPGNIGAILRSADGAGVAAVILTGGGTDLYNPNVIRASLGALFALPVCHAEPEALRAWLRENELAVLVAREDAEVRYTRANFVQPAAIVMGSEAGGATADWNVPGMQSIALPMLGVADSLNVSVSAAVLFYEALRQREEAR